MCEDDEFHKFYFRWKIKNFSFAQNKTGDGIKSPGFVVDVLDGSEWSLSVYPRGNEEGEYVDVFVTRGKAGGGAFETPVVFTIELEAADSSLQERRVSLKSAFQRDSTFGFQRYIKRATLLEEMKSTFLPDDVLTVHCTLERAPVEADIIHECIAESPVDTAKLEFAWTVNNWSSFGEVYKDVHGSDELRAHFRISICKNDDSSTSLVLKMNELGSGESAFASCRIAVLDARGSEALVRTIHRHFVGESQMTSQQLFAADEITDSYLQDGNLRLKCVLTTEIGDEVYASKTKTREARKDEEQDLEEFTRSELVRDFENMYLNGNFSDLRIRDGGEVVNCHKSVVYARSPIMGGLIDGAEQDSEGRVVIDIDDLDADTLEQMIYFMYTDKVRSIHHTNALKLFVAGHKYQIQYLKQKCSSYLSTAFSFENVYDILIAAHTYEDGALKRQAVSYIGEYFSRISLTSEWTHFRKTNKKMAAYVCREIRRLKTQSGQLIRKKF